MEPIRPRRAMLPIGAGGFVVLAVAAALAYGATPGDPPRPSVSSPDGALTATVGKHGDQWSLSVSRHGRHVLDTSLGRASGHPKLSQATVHDAFSTPAGKRRSHVLDARQLSLSFPHGRRIDIRVANDGVAFHQAGPNPSATHWRAPTRSRAWLQRYRRDYEGPYDGTTLGAAARADYGFPALLHTPDGSWVLLTESGLTRQAASHLTVSKPGVLDVDAHTSPWRVAVIGDLPAVVGSDLPLDLGRPSQIRNPSWIQPGRVAWSWWSDPDSPGDAHRQRQYIRAAARYGWQYVLLDEGWSDREVPRLVRYAAARHVRITLWTAWKALAQAKQRAELLDRWASWGVAGIKVDFLLSDSASRMATMDDIARDAAKRKLVVDFHGTTIPRGIQRTWPNVLTVEAVKGTERETDGQGAKAMDPRQDVNLVFTRNVVGSMDYTPVTFSARHKDSTDAHRLALAVVYESGLQHFADTPESYAAHPQAAQILHDVPAAWDDTRLLAGAPDQNAVLARRAGDTWWIGAISALGARQETVSLGFLPAGRAYNLHLVRDDGHGGLATEDRVVTSADTLSVAEESHGGFTAELTPRTPSGG